MRVAAIYDVHGNLPALEAVLAEVRREAADLVVVGGDVLPGPMPRECLDRLLALDLPARFIRGNGDRMVMEQMARIENLALPEPVREVVRWTAAQLDDAHRTAMSAWPATARVDVGGLGDVLFCHATPRSDTEIFTRLTAEERLRPLFADAAAGLVVCGHTHLRFDRMIGRTRVVNAGSVGMPFGAPGAHWLLLGPDVDLRRTPYDLDAAAARVRATRYPQAEDFAATNILHPPSEEAMLEAYGKVEIG